MTTLLKYYRVIKAIFRLPLAALGLPPHACRFTPSCSRYCETAVVRFGLFKGGILCIYRIIRCNPLTPPQHDPVPRL